MATRKTARTLPSLVPSNPTPKTTEIGDHVKFKGYINKIMFYNSDNSYAILFVGSARGPYKKEWTAKGTVLSPICGAWIEIDGIVTEDGYGRFLKIDNAKIDYDHTDVEGIYELLRSDLVYNVGDVIARRIVDAFGTDTLRVIREEPQKLREIRDVGKQRCQKLHESLVELVELQKVYQFFLPFIPQTSLNEILKDFQRQYKIKLRLQYDGDPPEEELSENKVLIGAANLLYEFAQKDPYKLYYDFHDRISFRTADNMALNGIRMSKEDPRRQAAVLYRTIEREHSAGHTFIYYSDIFSRMDQTLTMELGEEPYSTEQIKKICRNALNGKVVETNGSGPHLALYTPLLLEYEKDIARKCIALNDSCTPMCHIVTEAHVEKAIEKIENERNFKLDDSQKEAVRTVFRDPHQNVTVITGGPGCGKTTILQTVIAAWDLAYREHIKANENQRTDKSNGVICCAPTGRAAARMKEVTNQDTMTIHRRYGRDSDSTQRIDNVYLFIVDEMSMVNLGVAHMVFEMAERYNCRLILVGDIDQLPAIGPGNVLRNLIDSNTVQVVRLTSCHRNNNSVIYNANQTNKGEHMDTFHLDENFVFIPTKQKNQQELLVNRYLESVKALNGDNKPFGDYEEGIKNTGFLTPLRRKRQEGGISADELNLILRDMLNPEVPYDTLTSEQKQIVDEMGYRGKKRTSTNKDAGTVSYGDNFSFRPGDRVMLTKNQRIGFANGDLGFIREFCSQYEDIETGEIKKNGFVVEFDNACDTKYGSNVWVFSKRQMYDEFVLGYAMTIHKSQGAEFSDVIIAFDGSAGSMLQRNLLYTAITRAKNRCFILGSEAAVNRAIDSDDVPLRNTRLDIRLMAEAEKLKNEKSFEEELAESKAKVVEAEVVEEKVEVIAPETEETEPVAEADKTVEAESVAEEELEPETGNVESEAEEVPTVEAKIEKPNTQNTPRPQKKARKKARKKPKKKPRNKPSRRRR